MLGTRHQRIRPYTPRHNGKVERYTQILAEEFLYARSWTSEHSARTTGFRHCDDYLGEFRQHGLDVEAECPTLSGSYGYGNGLVRHSQVIAG